MESSILGSMPWPIRDLSTMKQELVEFALRPGVNRRELFSRYGISAPCAYKWLKRSQSKGVEGLAEHSRRPHHHPAQIGPEVVLRVLEVRDQSRLGWAQDLSLSAPEGFWPLTSSQYHYRDLAS